MNGEQVSHNATSFARGGVAYALAVGSLLSVVSPDSLLNPQLPHVDVRVADMPAAMPKNIADHLDVLTAIDLTDPNKTEARAGSGVQINLGDAQYTLTAGHILSIGAKNWRAGIYNCKTNTLQTAQRDNVFDTEYSIVSSSQVTAAAGHYTPSGKTGEQETNPDLALLKTERAANITLNSTNIGAKAMLNQIAWFENYQSYKGADRGPKLDGSQGQPVQFAGRIVGSNKHAAYVITNLGAHYGAHQDDQLRGGGSGGPVWVTEHTKKGSEVRLLGLSNATYLQPISAADVQDMFGVYPEGAEPGQQFALNMVGRTTPQELLSLAKHVKPCS